MRRVLGLLGLGCLALAAAVDRTEVLGLPREPRTSMGRLQRLAGPLGSAAASVQWMRFTHATRSGDGERALAVGRSALAMDPLAPAGWQLLAHHLAFERGSALQTNSPEARRRWILAGLDLLVEGAGISRDPAVLRYDEALVAQYLGTLPHETAPWPGCAEELLPRAIAGFTAAREAGHRRAGDALADALRTASALGIGTNRRGSLPAGNR